MNGHSERDKMTRNFRSSDIDWGVPKLHYILYTLSSTKGSRIYNEIVHEYPLPSFHLPHFYPCAPISQRFAGCRVEADQRVAASIQQIRLRDFATPHVWLYLRQTSFSSRMVSDTKTKDCSVIYRYSFQELVVQAASHRLYHGCQMPPEEAECLSKRSGSWST